MKKAFPYIIGGVLLLLLIILMTSTVSRPNRRMDERVTLRQRDRIPYGTKVAKELLSSLFPRAATPYDLESPGLWDSIETSEDNQAVILIADRFDAERDNLEELTDFVEKGNYVFIISRSASDAASSFFRLSYNAGYSFYSSSSDSLQIKLERPAFAADSFFTYPGKKYEGSFNSIDTVYTSILGRNSEGFPNFVQLNKGRGSFFIHAAPLAFSNYFILHKNNVTYYQQVLSVLPENISTILWNEYYLEKPRKPSDDDEPNWLGALFSYPAFRWGLLVGAFTLALFVLLGMRRRQRMIPPFERPKNDSLDFVKTLGQLYYDRKDHKNLATKMAAYFLEHVRSKYKLPTHTLDDVFVQALHFKSGYPEAETQKIITSIHNIKTAPGITEWQLADFHKDLELFYQNT
jgi:hypothetical protein